jgi:hypothetical protein
MAGLARKESTITRRLASGDLWSRIEPLLLKRQQRIGWSNTSSRSRRLNRSYIRTESRDTVGGSFPGNELRFWDDMLASTSRLEEAVREAEVT